MKTIATAIICACMALGTGAAFAQGGGTGEAGMKKNADVTAKGGMSTPTAADCQTHMAKYKDGKMKKDQMAMDMDKACGKMPGGATGGVTGEQIKK